MMCDDRVVVSLSETFPSYDGVVGPAARALAGVGRVSDAIELLRFSAQLWKSNARCAIGLKKVGRLVADYGVVFVNESGEEVLPV